MMCLLQTGDVLCGSYYNYATSLLLYGFLIMPGDPFVGCFAGHMKAGQDGEGKGCVGDPLPNQSDPRARRALGRCCSDNYLKKMHVGLPSAS